VKPSDNSTEALKNIVVRPLVRGDLAQILRLHETRDDIDEGGAEKRTRLLEWLAFRNPFGGQDETTYYVAEEKGTILAYHGRMPVRFVINGTISPGYFVHDLYVDPAARKRGLGVAITFLIARAIEEQSDTFFCLYGMTPLNRMMQTRRGYTEMVADSYLRRISIRNELMRFLPSPVLAGLGDLVRRAGLSAFDVLLQFRTAGGRVTLTMPDRFDEAVDRLAEALRPVLGICSLRTSAHLNWRYVDRPFPRERIIAAWRDGVMTGYAVVGLSPYKKDTPVGLILDLIADPADTPTIIKLIQSSVRQLASMGAAAVRCIMSDPRFAAVLRQCLFTREAVGQTMMLGNLHKSDQRAVIEEVRRWHMTRGESDSFLLSP